MSVAQPDTARMTERVRHVMETAVQTGRLVGAVVLVAVDGQPVVTEAVGLADRERGLPMRADTVFRLASLTKPVVTAAALALAEQGLLDLHAPVTRYLPDFSPALPDGGAAVITPHQLLTHTSGLTYGFSFPRDDNPYTRAGVSDGIAEPGVSLADNLARLATTRLVFAPGRGWSYSLGLDVMGGVIEKITGQPLPDVVRQHVGAPLGWRQTGFAPPARDNLAACYADARPMPLLMGETYVLPRQLPGGGVGEIRFAPDRVFNPASYPSGGAGMVGTAGEFLAFLEALRQGGEGLLAPASAALFGRNAIGDVDMGPLARGRRFGYGGAVITDPVAARTPLSPGSFTWGGVYGHQWVVDRARGISIVMLSNTALAGMAGSYPDAVVAAVYGG
ncbi:penicillin-binding protein [Komagataeibacter rhaeticus]|uniref:Beta-lactamase family protein n=1 Tax=Komagataeibacter rhaeticus TaxID=215221 RepID=A0A181CCL1_9PROT|nr:serine hydrolase domain-containing protein [Komagataeibacter rhaeticus]ATU71870.1 penicillin-binding protein [Komagataeibacter xylinus]EGG75581.1 Esterase estB [Gluconacetobacter sp. SXCC-1]KDU95840.1 penicillin-binding protein [Komagataeibacter rhaeticus AF1]MBL7240145.1 beta-lactamase family protein [Komagataeibacter rhaeticus]PYD54705.1 penicillin-binding protein [Komagataeibacter rhaeticus]